MQPLYNSHRSSQKFFFQYFPFFVFFSFSYILTQFSFLHQNILVLIVFTLFFLFYFSYLLFSFSKSSIMPMLTFALKQLQAAVYIYCNYNISLTFSCCCVLVGWLVWMRWFGLKVGLVDSLYCICNALCYRHYSIHVHIQAYS